MSNGCILVGNGSSVLEQQNGTTIDSFDTVVRFNQFHLQRFTPHVGTKSDVWFMVLPSINATWRAALPWQRIFTHSWVRDEAQDSNYQGFVALGLPCPVAKVPHHELIPEIQDFVGTDYHPWSTGALALWMMLKEFDQVTITGFDWWEKDRHHYFDNTSRGNLHRPEIEKQLIDKMCILDKVRFL